MMHFFRALGAAGLLAASGMTVAAQDTGGGVAAEELRELRKAVEQQAKQIEMLTREVARLGAALDSNAKATPAAPAGSAVASGHGDAAPPVPPPPPTAPETGAEDFATNPPPKAEPATPRHIVVKGDTLTSIAKQYNITIGDLQKANKEVNERKLQIGQSLKLPPNAQAKAPAATATPEPKQNP